LLQNTNTIHTKKSSIGKKVVKAASFFAFSRTCLVEGQGMFLHVNTSGARSARKEKEYFIGSFDQKVRCDDYSGVGVAGRAVRLDRPYDDYAIHAISCSCA
jgi:hypothetical protein